ncbi:16121_t:CDS:2 [Acaulospora colombiana]|uniref:16121_t:CDS:1 n=1 Tax=Acaulospora colombiana TaxID=27376 RepID=A0ACA9PCN3_9GLOM|nr:16121_t:CDS:2 [Acaulospora colombiana]
MAKEKTAKRSTGAKKLSPYNKYMKTELVKVKTENPELNHKEAFKIVAQRWKDSAENPKNQSDNAKSQAKEK